MIFRLITHTHARTNPNITLDNTGFSALHHCYGNTYTTTGASATRIYTGRTRHNKNSQNEPKLNVKLSLSILSDPKPYQVTDSCLSILHEHFAAESSSRQLRQWINTWHPVILSSVQRGQTLGITGTHSIRSFFQIST